jgi:hypothetical protein
MASSQNIFVWFRGGLNLPVRSDTLQNKILLGIRPRITRSCGVSDPAELSLAGYQTQQNNGRVVYILSDSADACSAGSDTLYNNVLRGLIPSLTKSCRVSDPAEQSPVGTKPQGTIFQYETEFKNILGCELGDYMGSIRGKIRRSKILCYCPVRKTVLKVAEVQHKKICACPLLVRREARGTAVFV